ncbi:Zinc finger protein 774 like protein [Argiope bruennichi]|uniref:Zinc finger protein 774 like protein n=1 Tax=Argiope bruennichi TaxID=94029 RepID=A0A8T0G3R1_ARGBR|nr:Zinc finger protein 774 like protein [Argiope bruennichi]
MDNKFHSNKNIKQYFTSDAWSALSEYEKKRWENVQKNFEILKSSGITPKMPEFMIPKFKRSMMSKNKTSEMQSKNNQEPKAKFKLFGVPKQTSSKRTKSIKGAEVSSNISVIMKTESISSNTVTTTMINLRGVKPKEFAEKILISAQNALKVLGDMLGGMEEDISFNVEEVHISKPGCSKAIEPKRRYPKRNVAKKCYKEEDISSEDEFLYCDICKEEHKGPCPVHGPMLLVCDTKVPKTVLKPHHYVEGWAKFARTGFSLRELRDPEEWLKKNSSAEIFIVIHYATEEEITGFSCNVCNGLFSSSESLMKHQRNHPHLQHDRRHRCPECSYSSDSAAYLRDHLRTHSREKPHACPHCPKRFSLETNLRKHALLHMGLKEHACNICGKRFSQKNNLLRHERVHSGERPYRCPDCGKDFSQSSHLSIIRGCTLGRSLTPVPNANAGFLRQVSSPNTSCTYTREGFPTNALSAERGSSLREN